MAFASVSDPTGIIELTLFGAVVEHYEELLTLHQVVLVAGTVTQDVERGIGVEVRRVEVLGTA